jgi:hypothetical protein
MKATHLTIFAGLLAILVGLLAAGTAGAVPIQWTGNGHFYEFVPPEDGVGVSWSVADAQADGKISAGVGGNTGYLATIDSVEEQNFLASTLLFWDEIRFEPQNAWIGDTPNHLFDAPNNVVLTTIDPAATFGYLVEYGGNGDQLERTTTSVPEPGILMLLGAGLAGLGLRSSRKKA